MPTFHFSILLFITLMSIGITSYGQDTIWTDYANTSLKQEKIYLGKEKLAENIYHANGEVWMSVRYDEQAAQTWKWYYENGNPYFEAVIIDDLLQGSYKIWYENGQLAEQLQFEDSIEQGTARFYYPNGQLAMLGTYKDGEMIETWNFYDTEGELANGKWSWRFAASPDIVRMQGNLSNGKRTGKWIYKGTANEGRPNQLVFEQVY